jgi:hypothetical protein
VHNHHLDCRDLRGLQILRTKLYSELGERPCSYSYGVRVVVVILLIARAGVRAAKHKETSANKFFVFLLIGMGCAQLASVFPIAGLGVLFFFYGLLGLISIGLRKLSQRGRNNTTIPNPPNSK